MPPTEESTCASSVVGIWHSDTPRRKVAAAKPATFSPKHSPAMSGSSISAAKMSSTYPRIRATIL